MKKLFKNPTTKKLTYLMFFLLFVFFLLDAKNLYIDFYNFRQLSQVRQVLDTVPDKNYNFRWIKEFNTQYNQSIEPIKNCYYISKSISSWKGYLLWTKLHSFLFSLFSYEKFYSYPKYNIVPFSICDGSSCYDSNKQKFLRTISNPCEDQ